MEAENTLLGAVLRTDGRFHNDKSGVKRKKVLNRELIQIYLDKQCVNCVNVDKWIMNTCRA